MRRAAAGIGLAGLLAACTPAKDTTTIAPPESWCPDGFESGPSDTCFALPEKHDKDTPIVIYLHGMYKGQGPSAEWDLMRLAPERGFAVIMPRGRRGLCAWSAEFKDDYCWPREAEDVDSFKSVVASWDKVLWQVDALLEGNGPHKRYVLAFSNGGSFAAHLAEHSLFPAQGYAIVGGAPLGPAPKSKGTAMLLLGAEGDAEQPKTKELHEGLAKSGWSHAYCTRPGAAPLTADDVSTALKFFRHDASAPGGGGGGASGKDAAKDKGFGCEAPFRGEK